MQNVVIRVVGVTAHNTCVSTQPLYQVREEFTHCVLPGQEIDGWQGSFDSSGDSSSLPGNDIQAGVGFGCVSFLSRYEGNREARKGSVKNRSE